MKTDLPTVVALLGIMCQLVLINMRLTRIAEALEKEGRK
jgi:hypothetical protein